MFRSALSSLLIPLSALVVLIAGAPSHAQPARANQQKLPPLSWTCPMHPDVVEDKPGQCHVCKMRLVPARLDSAWSCPVHTTITRAQSGPCPICKRDLVQITVSLFWTCR